MRINEHVVNRLVELTRCGGDKQITVRQAIQRAYNAGQQGQYKDKEKRLKASRDSKQRKQDLQELIRFAEAINKICDIRH